MTGCWQWGGEQWLDLLGRRSTWEVEAEYLPVGKMQSATRGMVCKVEESLFQRQGGLPEEQLVG